MDYRNPIFKIIILVFVSMFLATCTTKGPVYVITVSNTSHITRSSETVEIWANQLHPLSEQEKNKLSVFDELGNRVRSQWVDENSDAVNDYLLFQTTLDAKAKKPIQFLSLQIL